MVINNILYVLYIIEYYYNDNKYIMYCITNIYKSLKVHTKINYS